MQKKFEEDERKNTHKFTLQETILCMYVFLIQLVGVFFVVVVLCLISGAGLAEVMFQKLLGESLCMSIMAISLKWESEDLESRLRIDANFTLSLF